MRLSSAGSSVPRLYGEVRDLTRRRLREVGALGGGTWWLLFGYYLSGVNTVINPAALGWASFSLLAPTIAFPAAFIWLGVRTDQSMRSLRALEWLFVATTLLPLLFMRFMSIEVALAQAHSESLFAARFATAYCNFPCTAMIVVYGVFVPNTPRRAATMLSLMGVSILATDLATWLPLTPETRQAFADSIFQTAVMLFLGLGTAFYGSFKIDTLQSEALTARAQARELGQYHLTQLIGSGAMGEVYLADHRLLKRPCAVKLIRPERANDPKTLLRFEREVRATAQLIHPNIVEIYDFGRTENGTFYYVMEHLSGFSLDEVIRRHGPLPPGRALHLFGQLCGALRAAHQRSLVHRDIKPSNVFVCVRSELFDVVKLLDFGLVHATIAGELDGPLTLDGGIVGTPDYMSPEQADASNLVDGRSEIYSLGAVLHFMLTGEPPFVRGSVLQTIIAHRQEPLPPLCDRGCAVSRELESLLRRCLAKPPVDRFGSALELLTAARNCPESSGWSDELAQLWWQSQPGREVQQTHAADTAPEMTIILAGVDKPLAIPPDTTRPR